MKTTTKQACQLHSHEAFANVMGLGLVISVVWYQADIPVIMHLSVNWVWVKGFRTSYSVHTLMISIIMPCRSVSS